MTAIRHDGQRDGGGRAPDRRPTIVFLHGTRLTGASWAAQVAALGDAFHCLAPDLLGHGRSEGGPFTLDGAADFVVELIAREAHGGRAILVGQSLGGYVAMAAAARAPERISGLVLAGATAEPVGLRSLPYLGLAVIFGRMPNALLDRVNARYFRWRYPAAIADPIIAAGFSFGGGAVAIRALVGQRFKPRLAAYSGPTLLISGEFDFFFRPTGRSFAAVAANVERVVVRRATHLANLDQPARFSSLIRDFAERSGTVRRVGDHRHDQSGDS